MDVANVLNVQAQNTAAASKDKQTYEASLNMPPSEATRHSDAALENLQSFQFTNNKNIQKERAIHEQLKAQLQKDGYTTKAAIIAQNYSSRSDKGHGLLAT